jgi:hypothetical protein
MAKQVVPSELSREVHEYILRNFGEEVLNRCTSAQLKLSSDPRVPTELVLTLIVLEEEQGNG